MSSNYPPPSGIGNISTALGQFAQGWQNAKAQGRDREEQERRRNQEHANNLLQVLDSPIAQNPSMKASLMEAYADALDKAEAGPQKKKKQEGIGGLVKRMFGGGYDAVPDTQPGPMRAALNKSEVDRQSQIRQETFHGPAREEGRGDYGTSGLANFLGPAAANPISTQTPNAPMSRETVKPSAFPQTPDEQMSKVSAAPAPSPVAQYATAPRTPQSPQQSAATAQYANNYISPDKLVRSATVAHTGKYGIQDTGAIQRDVMTQAHAIINDLLDHVDSFIDVTPGHETLEQAYAHPQIRQALDGIRDYAHLTGQKFEDIVGSRFAKKEDLPNLGIVNVLGPDGKQVIANHNPQTGAITPTTFSPYEKSGNDPANIAEYNLYAKQETEAGRIPDSYRDFQLSLHPVGGSQSEEQRYLAGLMTPDEAKAFIARKRALDKPKEEYDDLKAYRIQSPGQTSFSTDKGFSQTQGGSAYDVGALIDAIRNTARTGMTYQRVEDAWKAYPEGSADKAALGQVIAAFAKKIGR